MKKVILWEPKRSESPKSPNEYVGKFRTKVSVDTPGVRLYEGTLATGKKYSYHAKEVDSVSGVLRWIDKRNNGEFGTNIVLFLESESYLHQISIRYDPYNLKEIVNHLCGLGKSISTQVINLSYWVRRAKNESGAYKVNDKGEAIWNKSISFRDISPQFDFASWKDFAHKNGLEWNQITKSNGVKEWNSDAEYKYWDSRILGIQRYLLAEGTALPFMYNTMIGCEAPNPSGGGNLTSDEIELCDNIYTRIRDEYKFPFSKQEVNADSVYDHCDEEEQVARIEFIERPKLMPDPEVHFSEIEVPANYKLPEQYSSSLNDDDLPF